MIKRGLYILALLAINMAVTFATAMAFMFFVFKQDPILAAVPALLAAPAILLQPWFVAFLFVPWGLLLAPFLTTIITVVVYGWLNNSGMLERPKLILSRFKTRKALGVIGGVVLLAVLVMYSRFVDFPSLYEGIPPDVRVSGLNVTNSRYYCLGSFIDSEWLWQAHISESNLATLAERFNLRAVGVDQVPDTFRKMPPYWWQPSITDQTRVLSTPDFPINERGPDGFHALASWNPDDEMLYVWIKNNF